MSAEIVLGTGEAAVNMLEKEPVFLELTGQKRRTSS